MHRRKSRIRRTIFGLGAVSLVTVAGAAGAAPASAQTLRPTTTRVACPTNIHVGTTATCVVKVSDVGTTPGGDASRVGGFVILNTNADACGVSHHGTLVGAPGSTSFCNNPNFAPGVYCPLSQVDSRSSTCTFTYTPTSANPPSVKIYATYYSQYGHAASSGSTTVNVLP